MKRITFFAFSAVTALSIITLSSSRAYSQASFPNDKDSLKHKAQVEEILDKMTTRQKVAQLFILDISRDPSERTIQYTDSLVREYGIGNLILMKGPVKQFIERVNHLQALAEIPLMVATDAEWGAAMRFDEYLPYPRQSQLGRIDSGAEKLLYKMGRNVGKELKDLNIMVNYAPNADVYPGYKRFGQQRTFGNDPVLVADLSVAYMKGMQDEGIYACGKHYPGHGSTNVDSHFRLPVVKRTKAALDSIDLYPFKRLIDNGLEMMMMAHISIPNIDPSGVPMSISSICINDILRKEHGFKGIVITDAVAMGGLTNDTRTPEAASMAVLRAGSDMVLMTYEPMKCIDVITAAVERGDFPAEEIEAKVRKVLMLKARAGYFEKGFDPTVRHLDRKIASARKRDYRLIKKMSRKISKSSKPYFPPTRGDGTLVLDRAGK